MVHFVIVLWLLLWAQAAVGTDHHTMRRCANETNMPFSKGRIAVGISGVSRGLHYTLPSIERHVFEVLRKAKLEFDVIWSSVSTPAFFDNPVDEFEVAKMKPCLFSIESQEYIKQKMWERFCKNRGYKSKKGNLIDFEGSDLTNAEYLIFSKKETRYSLQLKNYFCSFDSQSRLAAMIETHAKLNHFTYDAVLMIRPDVAFIRDIDLPAQLAVVKLNPNTIWIPDFQHFSDGKNDRAAFGGQAAMIKYLIRGEDFMNNNTYRLTIAEKFLGDYMHNVGLKWEKSTMRFIRVRPMEDDGKQLGIIDGFDINPKWMALPRNDPDLRRCAGDTFITHSKLKFQYKVIRADVC